MLIGCIIQARTSSTRLPSKVLKSLPYGSDVNVLQQVIRRVKRSHLINEIIIATTTDPEDQQIVEVAKKENVKWYCGSKENVLERYYIPAKEYTLNHVVRITSDCPCIDPELMDHIIRTHLQTKSDYTSNSLKRTFPHGLDTEVFSFETLEKAFLGATDTFEKEHVTPYIYKSHPELFKMESVIASDELTGPDIRITLDTPDDYVLLSTVYDYLYTEERLFLGSDIVKLFKDKPWLKDINNKILQKKSYSNLSDELNDAVKILKLQELTNAVLILESKLNDKA